MEEINKVRLWDRMPKKLKGVLLAISIITVVYWIGFCIYWILEGLRRFLRVISDKKGFWIFISCIVGMGIVCLLFAQFYFKLEPFNKFYEWLVSLWEKFRSWLGNSISG